MTLAQCVYSAYIHTCIYTSHIYAYTHIHAVMVMVMAMVMVKVVCIAHCHKVSNALCSLVTREQPSFQAPFEGHIVLLCTKVIGQRVPDCRTLHSDCSAANSGEPVSWHHHQFMCA